MELKVLSWNVWVDGDFEKISQFLKEKDADILGLQEIRDDKEIDISGFLKDLGYFCVCSPIQQSWDQRKFKLGPAVFSKFPIINSETYILSSQELPEKNKRAAARADIKVKNKILHIFSTHLEHTHQKPNEEQDDQAKRLTKILPNENTILMGDFNARPDSNAIKIISGVIRDLDPKHKQMSWSVDPKGCVVCNPRGILNERIDFIFATKDIGIKSFNVENAKGSDHLPLAATIEV
jgi:endonuclease/exonuclease/phosphatase family metal-dependent hydrolase